MYLRGEKGGQRERERGEGGGTKRKGKDREATNERITAESQPCTGVVINVLVIKKCTRG